MELLHCITSFLYLITVTKCQSPAPSQLIFSTFPTSESPSQNWTKIQITMSQMIKSTQSPPMASTASSSVRILPRTLVPPDEVSYDYVADWRNQDKGRAVSNKRPKGTKGKSKTTTTTTTTTTTPSSSDSEEDADAADGTESDSIEKLREALYKYGRLYRPKDKTPTGRRAYGRNVEGPSPLKPPKASKSTKQSQSSRNSESESTQSQQSYTAIISSEEMDPGKNEGRMDSVELLRQKLLKYEVEEGSIKIAGDSSQNKAKTNGNGSSGQKKTKTSGSSSQKKTKTSGSSSQKKSQTSAVNSQRKSKTSGVSSQRKGQTSGVSSQRKSKTSELSSQRKGQTSGVSSQRKGQTGGVSSQKKSKSGRTVMTGRHFHHNSEAPSPSCDDQQFEDDINRKLDVLLEEQMLLKSMVRKLLRRDEWEE